MALDGALVEKYSWVDEIDAWILAVIRGRPVQEIVEIYGGDPRAPVGDYAFNRLHEVRLNPFAGSFVQVFRVGEYAVALEENDYNGSEPDVARRCSADGGHFFSMFWNVNADEYVIEAVDGKIIASFNPLDSPSPDDELRPGWAIFDEPESTGAACVALLEQRTGSSG